LAHKLNDRKRDSEQCHAAKQVFSNLNVKIIQKTSDGEPQLIREDDVVESVGHMFPKVEQRHSLSSRY
jgi:hypothetical protein